MALKTHLTVLQWSATTFADSIVFKIPKPVSIDGEVQYHWDDVTYRQFLLDVERSARYWSSTLVRANIPRRSVIGLWCVDICATCARRSVTSIYRLGGMTYMDVLHIFGVARASYIPQLFSLKLPSPEIIYELMNRAGAKALIYDTSYADIVRGCHVPIFLAVDLFSLPDPEEPLEAVIVPENQEDIAMVFHTSGSTLGSPKLVPCTYGWLDAIIAKANAISIPCRVDRKDVLVCM